MMRRRESAEASRRPSLTDFAVDGMIHAIAVRSPIARGSLRSIRFPRLPAGYRVILPADIPGANRIVSFGAQIPVLAAERVAYVGEPVALIAGPDPILLEELVDATKVDCDEEELRLAWGSFSSDQVAAKRVAVVGDPELAFANATSVLEDSFTSGALEHYYSEPQGAAAAYDYDKMAIWCATQWPYHVRDSVALVLGCKEEEVSVRPTRLGVHLDGKLWYPSFLACHAALAAVACGRPVKVLLTRKEDFLYTPKRSPSSVSIRSALDSAGNVRAMDVRIALGIGAYAPLADEIVSQAVIAATGAYTCPNIRVEGYAVMTDTVPAGAFGGLGASHSFFAVEAHANRIASSLGEDPIEWKSRNVLGKGSSLLTGEVLDEAVPYAAISGRLAESSDFERKYACYELVRKRRSGPSDGPLRGIGFAFAYQGAGPFLSGEASNSYVVEVTLDKKLKVMLKTSAAAAGGGVLGIWRNTAATVLGVDPAAVVVAPPITGEVPNSGPITLSRNVTIINRLVGRACEAIQKRRFREPLPLAARSIYRVPRPIRWEEGHVRGSPFDTAAWAGAVVEMELDPWTREPRPLGIWLCVDGGQVVAPERAVTALRSGVVDALGACLKESMQETKDEAKEAKSAEYFRYGLQALHELPPIAVELLPSAKAAPVKGIGELPFDVVPAAFLSALSQAAGAPFSRLPVPAAELIAALESS
jgi:CO/xanthine dehydrogenase Mo-binding subunit